MILRREQGGASLIAITFASFLILILVISMASLMAGELGQAVDNENSIKAYYLAESNAELATRDIKTYLSNSANKFSNTPSFCSQAQNSSTSSSGVLTDCSISVTGQPYVGQLANQGVWQFDLSLVPQAKTLRLEWGGVDNNALLEATISAFDFANPPSNPPRIDSSQVASQFFCAGTIGPECIGGSYPASFFSTSAPYNPVIHDPWKMQAQPSSGDYPWAITMDNLRPGTLRRAVFRLKVHEYQRLSKDASSIGRFRLTAIDAGGHSIPIQFPDAQIDVTAKNGASYSRVLESLPVPDTGSAPINNVLFGDEGLCKSTFNLSAAGQLFQGGGYCSGP